MFSIVRDMCINCGHCIQSCPMGIFRTGESGPEVGPEKRCMMCMHCTAACPTMAIHRTDVSQAELYPPKTVGQPAALIQTRRSIRHYKAQAPTKALIQQALNSAAWAPSAKNARSYRWIVLYGKEQTDRAVQLALDYVQETQKAPELLRAARNGINLITCGAPCVILACAPQDGDYGALNTAIALNTAELLLVQEGLGTCWGGYLAHLASAAPALRQWLALPVGWQVYCTLMVGWPDGDHYPNVPRRAPVETQWVE